MRQGQETEQNHYISFPGSVPARHAELPQESYVEHLAQCDPHGMNLDYMEFGDSSRCSRAKAKSQFPVMEIPRHEFQQMGALNWSGDAQAASYELSPRPLTSPVGLSLFDTLFHEAFEELGDLIFCLEEADANKNEKQTNEFIALMARPMHLYPFEVTSNVYLLAGGSQKPVLPIDPPKGEACNCRFLLQVVPLSLSKSQSIR